MKCPFARVCTWSWTILHAIDGLGSHKALLPVQCSTGSLALNPLDSISHAPFLWALKWSGGEKACLLFGGRVINAGAAGCVFFPHLFWAHPLWHCLLHAVSFIPLPKWVVYFALLQCMCGSSEGQIFYIELSFIPVGYLSAWSMPSRLNFPILHGVRGLST